MGRTLSTLVTAILAYTALLEAMLYAAIRFFPDFEENLEALGVLARIVSMGPIFEQLQEGGVIGYVVGQQFFKGTNTMGSAAAVLFAIGAVAGEAHRGTFELWLARPFSRTRLLLERYAAGALGVLVPIFLTSATIPMLCAQIGEEVELWPMMLCSVQAGAMVLAIYSITFLLSSMGSNPVRIALGMLFFTTFSFAIYMVEIVTDWSIYRWSDIQVFMRICDGERLPWDKLGPLLGISAACLVGSLAAIRRRVP